ncbi:hypothetical protein DdX_21510 [Ditylenchus destructor]|uniref:Uncharacterized protein n=1 Tax=Ditylenchus destructor TaxID=166010 RepID=A0AAD4MET6_9BILA|nr:hypothetical protein DdX_21510 [Ditylenchus destructor]
MTNDTKAAGSPLANAPINAPARIEILLVGMNGDLRGKQVPPEGEKKIWDGSVRLPSSTQSLDIWGDGQRRHHGPVPFRRRSGRRVHSRPPFARRHALGAGRLAPGARHHARVRRHRVLHGPARHPCPHGEAVRRPRLDTSRRDGARILRGGRRLARDGQAAPAGVSAVPRRAERLPALRHARDRCAGRLPPDGARLGEGDGPAGGRDDRGIRPRPVRDQPVAPPGRTCRRRRLHLSEAHRRAGRAPLRAQIHLHGKALCGTCGLRPARPLQRHRQGWEEHSRRQGRRPEEAEVDLGRHAPDDARRAACLRAVCQLLPPLPARLVCAGRSHLGLRPSRHRHPHPGQGRSGSARRAPRSGCRRQSYLLLTAILGGILLGLDEELDPGPVTEPGKDAPDAKRLTHDFLTAVEEFSASPFIADAFGRPTRSFTATRSARRRSPTCARSRISITRPICRGFKFTTHGVAASSLLPSGRRWPEGSDEGARLDGTSSFSRLRRPPHPPAGTFSPPGRREQAATGSLHRLPLASGRRRLACRRGVRRHLRHHHFQLPRMQPDRDVAIHRQQLAVDDAVDRPVDLREMQVDFRSGHFGDIGVLAQLAAQDIEGKLRDACRLQRLVV